ncbi:hypothetical protein Q9966_016436 [Columba livia]|nr:hypothetical protein Q9966_016436 [Columba livia]KAK2512282.1 hypothetical protein Q9966_016436 [Columba livia]
MAAAPAAAAAAAAAPGAGGAGGGRRWSGPPPSLPDPRLLQYDCGKLQTLDVLLRRLKAGGHRVLVFTQMTRMLDVLERFLTFHGHLYLRLDGSTRVEQRQALMERFNADKRIFCFILSTRSGGVGVNLAGADTVVFYDSDWNPTMDAQAQDRCHRIGQTRDVHIYRLISERTVEENILKKANQKRMLGDMAIEGGNFTTAYFKQQTIRELFDMTPEEPGRPERDKDKDKDKDKDRDRDGDKDGDRDGDTRARRGRGRAERGRRGPGGHAEDAHPGAGAVRGRGPRGHPGGLAGAGRARGGHGRVQREPEPRGRAQRPRARGGAVQGRAGDRRAGRAAHPHRALRHELPGGVAGGREPGGAEAGGGTSCRRPQGHRPSAGDGRSLPPAPPARRRGAAAAPPRRDPGVRGDPGVRPRTQAFGMDPGVRGDADAMFDAAAMMAGEGLAATPTGGPRRPRRSRAGPPRPLPPPARHPRQPTAAGGGKQGGGP